MFDLVMTEPQAKFIERARGSYEYQHSDPANVSLFTELGAVRKVPVEALRQTVEGSALIEEPVPMPNYSALQKAKR